MSGFPRLSSGPSEFLHLLEQGIFSLEREQKRGSIDGGTVRGGLVEISNYDQIVIIGDLHGDSKTLFRILDEINWERFLTSTRNKIVFLGDYVDRGNDSIGVLSTLCQLKRAHPDSVILMRGNHEAPSEFPFTPQELPGTIESRFGEGAKVIYGKVLEVFRLLTLVTVLQDQLLMVHGGLPTRRLGDWKHEIATANENERNGIMEEILWNDPRSLENAQEWDPSMRGIGKYFGMAITERWLVATGTKVVVRGHEPCKGYRIDHHNKILTLFSSKEAYPNFGAAYLMATKTELDSVTDANNLIRFVRRL